MASGMQTADLSAALGSYWLYRAQPLLTRIYDAEATMFGDVPLGSSAETVACGVTSRVMSAATDDDTDSATMEQLRHRPDYVEARGLLSPATNFFSRAVEATSSTDPSYGYLLVEVRRFPSELQSLSQYSYSPTVGEQSILSFRSRNNVRQILGVLPRRPQALATSSTNSRA